MKTSAQYFSYFFARFVLVSVMILAHALFTPLLSMSGVDQRKAPLSSHQLFASLPAEDLFELPGDIYISKGKYYQYVLLNWKGHPDANCYQVYRRVAGTEDQWELIETIDNGNTQLHDNEAVPGVVYEYEVRALKLNKWTKKAVSLEKWRDSGYRKTKTLNKIEQVEVIWENNKGELRWSPAPRAEYYRLQIVCGASAVTFEEDQGYFIVDHLNNLLADHYVKDTIYHFERPNLSPDAVCYFRVRAENDREISDYTSFTPAFPPFDSMVNKKNINLSTPILENKVPLNRQLDEWREDLINQRAPSEKISTETNPQILFPPEFMNINKDAFSDLNKNRFSINTCMNIQFSSSAEPPIKNLLETQVLTSNSTGTHNTFRIRIDQDKGLQLKSFLIFDSRGKLIRKVKNRQLPERKCIELWKSDAPEGTYYFQLQLQNKDGRSEQFNGNIVIIK